MQVVKLVVTGGFGAGKSQFIRTISETEVVSTERKVTDGGEILKSETTVAMDFGRITVDDDLVLHLYGTPGQQRFDFMWEILAQGMLGFVILVDSCRPETFLEATRLLNTFRSFRSAPFVVAATKQDLAHAMSPEDMRTSLHLSEEVKLLPCVAIEKASVKKVLLDLLYAVLEEIERDELASADPANRST